MIPARRGRYGTRTRDWAAWAERGAGRMVNFIFPGGDRRLGAVGNNAVGFEHIAPGE